MSTEPSDRSKLVGTGVDRMGGLDVILPALSGSLRYDPPSLDGQHGCGHSSKAHR